MRNKLDQPPAGNEILRVAARQFGLVTSRQLGDAGLTRSQVSRWSSAGRFHPIHRGVYAVGHPRLTLDARCMAAVLACGPGAGLSHHAAAWRLGTRPWGVNQVDVTVPSRGGRARPPGVRVHRSSTLRPEQVTTIRGIPTTIAPRMILDLSDTEPPHALDRLIHEAEVRDLIDEATLRRFLVDAVGRKGRRVLDAILADYEATGA